jgi:hypothetical protein
MKLIILAISLMLASCASKYKIENFNMHTFSNDEKFITNNNICKDIFKTDEFNTTSNEVFRCSADTSNAFIAVESNGNNTEELKTVKFMWKQWRSDLNYKESKIKAQQFAAVFADLYLKDKEVKFIDSFFNGESVVFTSPIYKVKIYSENKNFYILRTATVTFNKN